MPQTLNAAIAVVGIDIGKNSFHIRNGRVAKVEARFDKSRSCAGRDAEI